jgi:hypothetical protein
MNSRPFFQTGTPAGGHGPTAGLDQAVGGRWRQRPRWYDWLRIPRLSWQMPGERWLPLRRSLADCKLGYVPPGTDLQTAFYELVINIMPLIVFSF